MNPEQPVLYLLEDAFWSALAALGFAVLFNVPRRLLVACMLCGAAGHATRQLLVTQADVALEIATFAGAMLIGVLGYLMAYRLRAPAIIFQVSAAIPLIPGAFAYRAMLNLIRLPNAESAAGSVVLGDAAFFLIRTGLILAAIAAGIAIPTLLFQRRTPVRD
jgi:uncharacterized membrane protein YjjB (DUF3815 family)